MFYLFGISITFFLSLLLLGKKSKSQADMVLACWLLVVGLHLLLRYLFVSEKVYEYPWLLGVHMPLPLFHGPFLYLYVATLTRQIPSLRIKDVLHFAPAAVDYLYLIPFFLLPSETKTFVFEHQGAGYEVYSTVNISAIILSGVAYVIWSTILLRRHRRAILDQYSDIEKINLDWLQYLIYGIAIIWVFVIADNDTMVFSAAVLFVLFIGYFGINQVGILAPGDTSGAQERIPDNSPSGEGAEDTAPETNEGKRKYSKSGLTTESAESLHRKLSALILREKPYKEAELTLADLAKRLNTVPNYLSQIINEKEGKNFYDYINTLRIEEFKALAADPSNQQYTLLALAYDCGFNSKSSFNKYFRKVTGLSPSEYVRQME